MPHEERLNEFLTAALCHATKHLSADQLAGFPGLAEWKKRHDAIDAASDFGKVMAAVHYDEASGVKSPPYGAPKFMEEFMRAFPK
jgi:hypothetical protein